MKSSSVIMPPLSAISFTISLVKLPRYKASEPSFAITSKVWANFNLLIRWFSTHVWLVSGSTNISLQFYILFIIYYYDNKKQTLKMAHLILLFLCLSKLLLNMAWQDFLYGINLLLVVLVLSSLIFRIFGVIPNNLLVPQEPQWITHLKKHV